MIQEPSTNLVGQPGIARLPQTNPVGEFNHGAGHFIMMVHHAFGYGLSNPGLSAPLTAVENHCPECLERGRHHLDESLVQRAVRDSVVGAGLMKRATCHTFRHSFATHLLEKGYGIRSGPWPYHHIWRTLFMTLTAKQQALCEGHSFDFSGLSALFVNCTLKPSGQLSHTEKLMEIPQAIMQANAVTVKTIRAVDYELPPGVYPDMREHGFKRDDWPELCKDVMNADILVMGTPIWLGEESSVCRRVIERLYGESGKLNDKGQYVYYGRVAGSIITGNEDGVKHCAMTICYALQHNISDIPYRRRPMRVGSARQGRVPLMPTGTPAGRKMTLLNAILRS